MGTHHPPHMHAYHCLFHLQHGPPLSPGQLSSESKEGSLHMVTLSLQLMLGATSPAGKLTGVSLMALSPFYKSSLTMRRMPSFVRRNLQTTSSDAIKFVPITSRVQCPLKLTI